MHWYYTKGGGYDLWWVWSGPPRAWRGPGAKFLGGALFQFFGQQQPPPPPFFGRVRSNCFPATLPQIFIPNFGTLPPKNKYLALCAEIFRPKKWLGPNIKFLGAPRAWGTGAICPPPPPSRRPWVWFTFGAKSRIGGSDVTRISGPKDPRRGRSNFTLH